MWQGLQIQFAKRSWWILTDAAMSRLLLMSGGGRGCEVVLRRVAKAERERSGVDDEHSDDEYRQLKSSHRVSGHGEGISLSHFVAIF